MNLPKFSYLLPATRYPRKPEAELLKDLARVARTDAFVTGVLQVAYQGWQTANTQALASGLSAEERAYRAGKAAGLQEFIIGLEAHMAAAAAAARSA
jgi:hypothetical protein